MEKLLGRKLSASVVAALSKLLAEEVRKFHRRPRADYGWLIILNGVWRKVGGYNLRNKGMLVVYGIRTDSQREVLDFRQARSESRTQWEAFLWEVYRRGLKGADLPAGRRNRRG